MAESSSISNSIGEALRCSMESRKGPSFYMVSNPRAAISKRTVMKCSNALSSPNAEEFLGLLTGQAFSAEAEKNGVSLVECIQAALEMLEQSKTGPSPMGSPRHLASLLTLIAPGEDGAALLERLKNLLGECGEKAVQMVDDYDNKYGRNDQGYVCLRPKKGAK